MRLAAASTATYLPEQSVGLELGGSFYTLTIQY